MPQRPPSGSLSSNQNFAGNSVPLNHTAMISNQQVKKVQSNITKQVVPSIQIKGTLKQNMVTKTRSNARSHSLSDAANVQSAARH